MSDGTARGAENGDAAAIDRDRVLAIAHLARLRLDDDEADLFAKQLSDILAHAQEIADSEAGAGGEGEGAPRPESAGAGARPLRLRDGDAAPDPLLADPVEFAPEFEEGLFSVPRLEAMEEEPAP